MPAFDRLINSLSEVLKASNLPELNLWRVETLVMKLLAAFAVELLQMLIELAHGQGYEGSRHKCPQVRVNDEVRAIPATAPYHSFRGDEVCAGLLSLSALSFGLLWSG